jgi:hypothetical protein
MFILVLLLDDGILVLVLDDGILTVKESGPHISIMKLILIKMVHFELF